MGCGSWGTTFAQVVAHAGHNVMMWGRRQEVVDEINTRHQNSDYLGDIALSDRIRATTDPSEALAGRPIVILAVPAQSLRAQLEIWKPQLRHDAILVSLMKGVERGTHLRMSQVIVEATGWPEEQVAVVSGPNLAMEIAQRQPCATVVASRSEATAELLAHATANSYFRPYTNTDVIGVELGGAVKNVIALACGIAEGRGLGDNSKASLITRGLAETTRLAVAMGADPQTMSGLAGLGDLVATCASPLSRNHSVGVLLGKGLSLEEVVAKTKQTAEGVKSSAAILQLAASVGADMPITEAVVAVIAGKLSVEDLADLLLSRARKSENK
ncbi:NAD(P)H-dependent glycerol-3-phosphate dehydrogenase [Saxibacter everestensis]|uniref:Glycerol-3-phosphate dehydrogenase [NAD(P)+] n=1 Tax=Saxibacter everestensis TaxID=2909229 RepID=A0ABY8QYY9_9MICO|nr:NAD(P)H-dependent glycerol-3-phosphate dehydrogenase [Brevibacteriaceae bacterium ZFBP1038]